MYKKRSERVGRFPFFLSAINASIYHFDLDRRGRGPGKGYRGHNSIRVNTHAKLSSIRSTYTRVVVVGFTLYRVLFARAWIYYFWKKKMYHLYLPRKVTEDGRNSARRRRTKWKQNPSRAEINYLYRCFGHVFRFGITHGRGGPPRIKM